MRRVRTAIAVKSHYASPLPLPSSPNRYSILSQRAPLSPFLLFRLHTSGLRGNDRSKRSLRSGPCVSFLKDQEYAGDCTYLLFLSFPFFSSVLPSSPPHRHVSLPLPQIDLRPLLLPLTPLSEASSRPPGRPGCVENQLFPLSRYDTKVPAIRTPHVSPVLIPDTLVHACSLRLLVEPPLPHQ